MVKTKIENPILPGFYPDPSICRVKNDYYMVTSSFDYFPGVPIFHSTDLMNWEQIGHVLDRPSQLTLDPRQISGGIFAPTLRFYNGVFYMITTNISYNGNFIVTAEDPAGPWSEPHWIEGAPGIDPSLFWDDDGKAYYTGTTLSSPQGIWLCEIDLEQFQLAGEKVVIWNGALVDCAAPEAPHIYKKDGWYYLMIAEGGTEHFHAVTIARSRQVAGPYDGYPGNPILTHRHLGRDYPIANTGHADLIETRNGDWYMVFLASRIYGGYHKNMGRETFMAPVIWEDDWPVVSPGTGKVEWQYPATGLAGKVFEKEKIRDEFEGEKLKYIWNVLGTPVNEVYRLEDSRLKLRTVSWCMDAPDTGGTLFDQVSEPKAAAFVGRRQQHMSYEVQARMSFEPKGGHSAGLVLLQNNYHQYRIEMLEEDGIKKLQVIKGYKNLEPNFIHNPEVNKMRYQKEICGSMRWMTSEVILGMKAEQQKMKFYAVDMQGKKYILAENLDAGFLGSETSGGFVGAYIGMFASGNGKDADHWAEFDWFSYEGKE